MRLSYFAAAVTIGLALPATPAAAKPSRVAYFKVTLEAAQDVTWSHDLSEQLCTGEWVVGQGKGETTIRVATRQAEPAVARRVGGIQEATLLFRDGRPLLPVGGTYARSASRQVSDPTGPAGECPGEAIPVPPDCGSRSYPEDTVVSVLYRSPETWFLDDEGPAPLVPSVALTGPHAPEWLLEPPFLNCPGVNGDDELRGAVYGTGTVHSTPGALPPAKLFGPRRRFSVRGHSDETVDSMVGSNSLVRGTWPVTTKTRWTLRFRRLDHRPAGL